MIGRMIPDVTLRTRVRDEAIGGPNPFRWAEVKTLDLFAEKRAVVFSLPGAFTPTCSNEQCPAFEQSYDEMRAAGVDEVYCVSVNDAFARHLGLRKVKLLPDGSADFTRRMGMLIRKDYLGFGLRSWRYAMVVEHGKIAGWFEEPGINDEGLDDDPYGVSSPDNVLRWLHEHVSDHQARDVGPRPISLHRGEQRF
jgi:thioredoxin-dependent peroxiredoxin